MIKYLGSKRRLIPLLSTIARGSGARTGLDLFTGTTRVAQAFKSLGMYVTAVDSARYAHLFARCYIETDGDAITSDELARALSYLTQLPGVEGYITATFSDSSRFFQRENAMRIDAISAAINAEFHGSVLYPILLTSLIEAADRIDSTVGVQMAYVKSWATRSFMRLELRSPILLSGEGRALLGDATQLVTEIPPVDIAYLDPPYNQHRYVANYHIWETLVEGDTPEHYGVACKRVDLREDHTKSVFNSKRTMPDALRHCIDAVNATVIVLSYNDESWITLAQLQEMMGKRGELLTISVDSPRYVGARIGIFNPKGEKVGAVSRLRNTEYVLISATARRLQQIQNELSADANETGVGERAIIRR
jgi:adenine-specific DNA-methyltransferase